jgi:hypothetical protein
VDLPTVDALNAEWRLNPPIHMLVAAYLGYKPPVQTSAKSVTDIDELIPDFGNVPIRRVAPVDTSAFDAAMQEKTNV